LKDETWMDIQTTSPLYPFYVLCAECIRIILCFRR